MFFLIGVSMIILISLVLERLKCLEDKQRLGFCYKSIIWVSKKILGIRYEISGLGDVASMDGERILVVANHPSLVDFISLLHFHYHVFPEHDVLFVIKRSFSNIPLFGKYFSKYHLLMEKNMPEEELESLGTKLKNYPNKCVVYIFPEGTSFCTETHSISRLCEDGKELLHTLLPKTKGLNYIFPHCDKIIDLTILNKGVGKAEYELNLLWGDYPKEVKMMVNPGFFKELKDRGSLSVEILELWKMKDQLIQYMKTPEETPWTGVLVFSFMTQLLLAWSLILNGEILGCLMMMMYLLSSVDCFVWGRHQQLNEMMVSTNVLYSLMQSNIIRSILVFCIYFLQDLQKEENY